MSKAADGEVNIEQWRASRERKMVRLKKKHKYCSPSYVDKHSDHVGQITSVGAEPPHVCHSLRKEELRVKTFPQGEWQASVTGGGAPSH